MGVAKRGKSLEERLLEVRASDSPGRNERAKRGAARRAVEEPIGPTGTSPVTADAAPDDQIRVDHDALIGDATGFEPAMAGPSARLAATEGDTFLPAESRVDSAAATAAARRPSMLPEPERDEPQEIAVVDELPATAALTSSLADNWLPLATAGESPAEIANEDPVDASTAEFLAEPEEMPRLSSRLVGSWFGSPRVTRGEPREDVLEVASRVAEDDERVDMNPVELAGEIAEPEAFLAAVPEPEAIAPPGDALDADEPWNRRVRTQRFGRIGTTLVERGLISATQLDEALAAQRKSGRRVGELLVELGALSAFDLARVLADHMGVPFTDLASKPPDPILATLLPEEVARRYDALAIDRWNDQLVIAMANPTDLFALDDLQMVTRQPIIAAMAVRDDLRAAIDRSYRGSIVETVLDAATSDYADDLADSGLLTVEVDEGPIVGLVNALMSQAITDHASDLHIEPSDTNVAVRFRVDGVLHDSSSVPLELLRPLVSRVKILAGLDIAQNRIAQDGRFSLTIEGRSVDVRVVTMPTAAGEAVILRLLDPIRDALGVSSLGLDPAEHARFIPAFSASQGAVFIAGPTGSGKTSTIYAALSEVNTRSKSIISIEDPVEFRLNGIKQIQINPRVGLTFPTTLPSVLRADPDIVFIGEVRDTETARIAADASITGHLVLSTVHATRAAAAPMRLIEMGVEPYLVASALTLVASQRLARKLCEQCAEPAGTSEHDRLRAIGADAEVLDSALIRRPVGCPACRGTGYRGRLPIFEIMPVTEGISRLILDRAPRLQIEALAVEEGMDTLRTAALHRVARGDLGVDELMRVIS